MTIVLEELGFGSWHRPAKWETVATMRHQNEAVAKEILVNSRQGDPDARPKRARVRIVRKMSDYNGLGALVTLICKTFEDESNDYDRDGSGECSKIISDGWGTTRLNIIESFGFANAYHFMAIVERRTSAKWVYKNRAFNC